MENHKKQKKVTLLSVLLAILMVGGILLVLLNGPLASSEDKAAAALEKTSEKCKTLLRQENYEEIIELFDSVSKYPQCQAEIKQQLKAHVSAEVKARDAKQIPKVYGAFQNTDVLFDVVMEGIREGAEWLYNDSYADFMIFHQALTEELFYLEDLDAYVMRYIFEQLDIGDYTFAGTYIHILDHCEVCSVEVVRQIEERMVAFLQNGQYENASILYSYMRYWDMKEDVVGPLVLDCANSILEDDPFNARYLLQILKDNKHPVYDLDAEYNYRLATMCIYIKEGKFAEAEKYAMSFAGQIREKLLEVLQNSRPNG